MIRRRAVVVLGFVLLIASPASAHPFGPPPTARIVVEGDTVVVDWSATPDDAVAIGESLGVMPEGSIQAYRQDAAAQVAPSAEDEAALSASPLLHEYLAEHITAHRGGRRCRPRVPPVDDFVHDGARVLLRCDGPVTAVRLRITMLHDLHPAYRTLAVGRDSQPDQAVFTTSAPEHEWRFGDAARTSGRAPITAAAVGAVVGLTAAVLLAWARRRNRGDRA